MNKYTLHVQTQPMLVGALNDGRRTLRWATDYFLRAQPSPNIFFGQVGRADLDHSYWGSPEDMMMLRPAFRIDMLRPGKLATCSFFLSSQSQLSSAKSTACAKCPRHYDTFSSKILDRRCNSRHCSLNVFILRHCIY